MQLLPAQRRQVPSVGDKVMFITHNVSRNYAWQYGTLADIRVCNSNSRYSAQWYVVRRERSLCERDGRLSAVVALPPGNVFKRARLAEYRK